MSTEPFEIAQAVLLSLGGGGAIVFGLSSFLGKVWAQKILQSEKVEHDKEIAKFRNELDHLASVKALNYQQKIDLYKLVSNPLVELVALLDKEDGLTPELLHEFNRQRLHITAQLALFAPQNVFESFNNMVDYIYDSIERGDYEFCIFRDKAMLYLS